jgi:Flp pilus assembly protein TadD
MARSLLTTAFCALWLAACQTQSQNTDVMPTITPSLESTNIMSNDPSRLAKAHFTNGNFAMAERHFKDAVEKNPQDVESWVGLAASYDHLKRFDLADRAYDRALKIRGDNVMLLNNRGYSLFLRGDLRRARLMYDRALKIEPGNEMVLNNLKMLSVRKPHVATTPL